MADEVIRIVWDDGAVRAWTRQSPEVLAMVDRMAALVIVAMKAAIPVSPVMPVYARPVPAGSSRGQVYRGRGLALPKGPDVSRYRAAGDAPLRPSGYTRSSVRAFREPDGAVIVGPTAPWSRFLNDGTPPHVIRSTGPWPLRNRATGQVFGREVHHPGTRGAHFVEAGAAAIHGLRVHVP
jgi:hypothetical protein